MISGQVEPGERILWAGRPDREAMLGRQSWRFRLRMALTPVLLAGVAWHAVRAFAGREALVVERYDRIRQADGRLVRHH